MELHKLQELHRKLVARAYVSGHRDFYAAYGWMDTNSDGVLDMEEFSVAMHRMCKLSAADMQCLERVFDANGDGQVDFEEFVRFLKTRSNSLRKFLPEF